MCIKKTFLCSINLLKNMKNLELILSYFQVNTILYNSVKICCYVPFLIDKDVNADYF